MQFLICIYIYIGVSENSGKYFPPNHPFFIGFSIIFTIHFGVFFYFWKHPYSNKYKYIDIYIYTVHTTLCPNRSHMFAYCMTLFLKCYSGI